MAKRDMKSQRCFYISNSMHGPLYIKAGMLKDVFTPTRKGFTDQK